jgi:hypothetical protein
MARNNPGEIGRVSFPITVTVVSSLILLAVTVGFYFLPKPEQEVLVFFSTGAAAVGIAVTAYYTAKTLNAVLERDASDELREVAREAREVARDGRERGHEERESAREKRVQEEEGRLMRRLALRFGERWNDPAMYHVRNTLREVMDFQAKSQDELINLVNDPSKRTNVIHVFNFLEEIAVALKYQLVDSTIVSDQFCGIILAAWARLTPWIHVHRNERADQRIWDDLEALYATWKRQQK